MINIKNKLIGILFISIFFILLNNCVNAKYIIKNEFYIANLNIDRTKPKIELIDIKNTNIGFEKYANKTHTITINVKIIEKNIKNIFFDEEHIKVKIDNNYVDFKNIKLEKIEDIQDGKIYQIQLNNLQENGKLKVEILEGTVIDIAELKNELKEIDTKITIDNIAPNGDFSESKLPNGKINGKFILSENIRDIEGWKYSEDKLSIEKEFTNNISYELPIIDYAGNKTIINVEITQATYINITYASHNSEVGWSFGYGKNDIAGKEAIKMGSIYKTESLAFNVSGNIDSDFLQAKAYIYTYWGEGSTAKCLTSGMAYNHGYNPNDGSYKSMKSNDLVTIGNKKYFQFGGSGINTFNNTDINGNNPIPSNIIRSYPYGICGISLKLKDYSQYSVVYQILVDKVGWIKACSDGEECMYNKESPMSAFRITLIPKTEKQYILDTWNKDVGTCNIK